MSRGALLSLIVALGGAGAARAGATRCWIDDGALVVAASFGGMAGDFLVETAAPYSQVNQTEASAAGYDESFAVGTLRLAGHRLDGVRLPLVSLDALPQTDTAILGVIGQDVLARYDVRVRFSPCRVTLSRPRRGGERGLRVVRLAGLPAVQTRYGDGLERRAEPMLIGTGRWESLIPRAQLSRTAADGAHPPIRLTWIDVKGRRLAPAPAGLAEAPVGTLGLSVWSRWRGFRLTRGRLILER